MPIFSCILDLVLTTSIIFNALVIRRIHSNIMKSHIFLEFFILAGILYEECYARGGKAAKRVSLKITGLDINTNKYLIHFLKSLINGIKSYKLLKYVKLLLNAL